MKAIFNNRSYNTKTAKHICGTWDLDKQIIKELHLTRTGLLFFAVYSTSIDEYIIPTDVHDALLFIDTNKKKLKWFPNGQNILQWAVNNTVKPDDIDPDTIEDDEDDD